MDWLKPLLPILETTFKLYVSDQVVKKTSQNAKNFALKGSVVAFGGITCLSFLLASIVMVFVDLGHQFETHDGVHFSGMMLSGLYLATLGLVILGISFLVAKIFSVEERQKKKVEEPPTNPYAPLILFGEEFLKQLIVSLSEKKSGQETK